MTSGTPERIDFEKEIEECLDTSGDLWGLCRSIAARVEEETITRFMARAGEAGIPFQYIGALAGMNRLYAPDKGESKNGR